MGVVRPPLHPELNVTQLRIVDELGIDAGGRGGAGGGSGPAADSGPNPRSRLAAVVDDPLDSGSAETGGEYVCKVEA